MQACWTGRHTEADRKDPMRHRHRRRVRAAIAIAIATTVAALAAFMPASAVAATLYATVGPGYTISLTTPAGATVRSIAAGRQFDIVVRDRSEHHNFRLSGPGFVRQTGIAFAGTTRPWRVTFTTGTWNYLCQPHPTTMRGSIAVR